MSGESSSGASGLRTIPDHLLKGLTAIRVAPGDILAERFRVGERLGDGAMGEVYAAENLAIGMPVAVKVLRGELLIDEQFRARFQQEAEAIASVRHPNVVRFLDLVVGSPTFLVMERVRGKTLAAILKEANGPLEVRRVVNLMEQICWGMHAVHRVGVIHRDLKPSNVLVEEDDQHGELPKIIDFGLAKMLALPDSEPLTRTGQIVGTPDYMSPEQIAAKPVDARADMYSLGCLAYQLLTGRLPFISGAPDRSAKEDLQVLYQHIHEEAKPPSVLNPKVPPSVDAVVLRMLEKLPVDRYGSMQEAASAWLNAVEKRAYGSTGRGSVRSFALGALATFVLSGVGVGGAYVVKHRAALASATLLIDTTPAGAAVRIDGVLHGEVTPTAVTGLIAGPHRFVLQHAGFGTVERTIDLAAAERRALQISLPAQKRTVSIKTIPDGAQVFLDNQLIGVTPIDATYEIGDFHELRFEKTGYETQTRALKPEDDLKQLALSLVAETQRRGAVVVESDVSADVWIDGSFTGFRAPTIPIQVADGGHKIELRDGDKVLSRKDVNVERGQTVHLSMRPGVAP